MSGTFTDSWMSFWRWVWEEKSGISVRASKQEEPETIPHCSDWRSGQADEKWHAKDKRKNIYKESIAGEGEMPPVWGWQAAPRQVGEDASPYQLVPAGVGWESSTWRPYYESNWRSDDTAKGAPAKLRLSTTVYVAQMFWCLCIWWLDRGKAPSYFFLSCFPRWCCD